MLYLPPWAVATHVVEPAAIRIVADAMLDMATSAVTRVAQRDAELETDHWPDFLDTAVRAVAKSIITIGLVTHLALILAMAAELGLACQHRDARLAAEPFVVALVCVMADVAQVANEVRCVFERLAV